jgi:hypothetical protein
MDELAYGTDTPKRKDVPFYGMNAFEGFADKVNNLATIPKRGMPIELAREVEKTISIAEFFKRLRNGVGRVTPELNRQLRAEFGESIDIKTAEEVIARITCGEDWSSASGERQRAKG